MRMGGVEVELQSLLVSALDGGTASFTLRLLYPLRSTVKINVQLSLYFTKYYPLRHPLLNEAPHMKAYEVVGI